MKSEGVRKWILLVLVLTLASAVFGCAFGDNKMIGKDAAFQITLEDAGLKADEVTEIEIKRERAFVSVWYEVNFEFGRTEYEYRINAKTGEIVSAITD